MLLVAILHAIPDTDHPTVLVRHLTWGAAPGSMLVVSHFAAGLRPAGEVEAVLAASRGCSTPATSARDSVAIRAMMGRFEPVEPGIVPVTRWRPDREPPSGSRDSPMLGAIGHLAG